MKRFIVKHKKKLTILLDILVGVLAVVGRFLTDHLLTSTNEPCDWTLVGAQCGTCGGTRCINHILYGDLIGAFQLNPFVFLFLVYLLVGLVLLNIYVFAGKPWPWKVLEKMFSLRAVIIILILYFLFIILRNLNWIRALITVLGRRQ